MWLICAFLRMVRGGGKGEGYSPSVRASIQPDTTVGTVRFRTQHLKDTVQFLIFLALDALEDGFNTRTLIQFTF